MTLGISTNTRLLGLAVMKAGSLVEYRIHLHKSSWSPAKARLILKSLEPCVLKYSIKKVVLSIPPEYYQTDRFRYLVREMKTYFTARGIQVNTKKPEAFHRLYPPGRRRTRKGLMDVLVERFPQLTYCYRKELRNKNKYYIKLFEAVAAAMLGE